MVISELIDLTIKYATGDANVRARMYGRAVGELIIALAGPKGITGVLNVLKDLTKVMKLGDVINGISKGAKAAEVVALIDRIAETVSKIKNILKTNVQDIIIYVKQISKFDNYYEVVTPDGQVFKIMKDEIPVENISKINNISEGALKGLGKIAGNSYEVTSSGINKIKSHLASLDPDPANDLMIKRLESALENGQKLEGADASFYLHELKEADLMAGGMGYNAAHEAALEYYGVSRFSVYHPDVIKALSSEFNDFWKKFWGLI
ncbi:hypothetical protein CSC2_26780 [Clostridium zeae]|uniref:Pre-toxin TG domain-containing protein n=1 Tax=Clostridium zeae TaxID=2759022 RepID=A0ABQ1EBH1_9CLOT|nr:hypothetical protein [Clostridium zeae]GFZ32152.1 hypothetical protein CSC2_26780 [Clostridium zeae]